MSELLDKKLNNVNDIINKLNFNIISSLPESKLNFTDIKEEDEKNYWIRRRNRRGLYK